MADFFEVTIVGMRFQPDVTQSQVLDMPKLFLKPQPDNPYDPKAIAVIDSSAKHKSKDKEGKERILGHVSRDTIDQVPKDLPPEGRAYELYLCDASGPHAVRAVAFANNYTKDKTEESM